MKHNSLLRDITEKTCAMIWMKYCETKPPKQMKHYPRHKNHSGETCEMLWNGFDTPKWMKTSYLNVNYIESNDDCPICMEKLEKCVKTQCSHYFHYDCIEKINDNLCPLCRQYLIYQI